MIFGNKPEKIIKKHIAEIADALSRTLYVVFHDETANDTDGSTVMMMATRIHSTVTHAYIFTYLEYICQLLIGDTVDKSEFGRIYMTSVGKLWEKLLKVSIIGQIPPVLPLDNGGDPLNINDVWKDYVENEKDNNVINARDLVRFDFEEHIKRTHTEHFCPQPMALFYLLKTEDWDNPPTPEELKKIWYEN